MKTFFVAVCCCLLLAGCSKDMQDNPHANKTPKTFLWLYPDSLISQGASRQHIRWWGDDPDGVIKGYLFASGKFTLVDGKPSVPAGTAWRWVTKHDSLVAFPLLVKKDTFEVTVRAVDNTFTGQPTENALIFLSPQPYWDRNEDSTYEEGVDLLLPSLTGAMDPVGGYLGMPVLNQPPSIVFAQNPNDPSSVMQQPDTTFTAATFAWIGSDPDGDKTIDSYEIALNRPYDSARTVILTSNINMITLVVPGDRSADSSGEVEADLYTGTFPPRPNKLPVTLKGLKLNSTNTFYIRARDVAGDTSRTLSMPDPNALPVKRWYVKKPSSRLLIVNDFISNVTGRRDDVLQIYKNAITNGPATMPMRDYEVLDIARGLTAQNKKDGKVGTMVPPFINPALLFTLHLFDVVLWYTDPFPSLSVAQYPLFEYVRDEAHAGKVIYSTMFEVAIDPGGALKDFAPIDSISSVDLLSNDPITGIKLVPLMGDLSINGGTFVDPDSGNAASIYPVLQFSTAKFSHSLFLRNIYNRADARYIYHMPQFVTSVDNPNTRYAYVATLGDLRTAASKGGTLVAAGVGGTVLLAASDGDQWLRKKTDIGYNLNSVQMLDASSGWIVGDSGSIIATNDGGATWMNHSVPTFENLNGEYFTSPTAGVVVGTSGILIRTINGGSSWSSPPNVTRRNLRTVAMGDATTGVAAGDSVVIRTTDGGSTWSAASVFPKLFYLSVRYSDAMTATAVTRDGSIIRSTDGGNTWNLQTKLIAADCRSVYFADSMNGWICGNSTDRNDLRGYVMTTSDGGITWSEKKFTTVTQHLYGVTSGSTTSLWAVGSNGLIIHTTNGGTSWATQPKGQINVGVVDNARSFVFLGLPLHILNGSYPVTSDANYISQFLNYVMVHEFGL